MLGRLTDDAVSTLGSGVDDAIRRIETIYDTAGHPFQFTSYDAASGGNVVNQIERHYNGLGQLTEEFQEHSGAVNTATSPSVQYVWSEMVSGANHSRLVRTVYPNGRIVRSEYGTAGGLNDQISRLEYLADDAGGSVGTHLEELSYLGVSTVVRRAHPEPGVDLTYIKQTGEPDGDAGDQYAGLDRFDRVVDQRWIDTSTLVDTDRFGYGHDRDGNRLYRENLIDAALSELYHEDGAAGGYDLLNRLTAFQRGTLNGSKDTIGAASREQVWDLDALGNWDSLIADGGAAQTRTHNAQNQVTGVNGQTNPTFDNNGNTTTDETGKKFTFDAWNRLRAVRDASNNLLETLTHDALNRRIELAPQSGTARALYYSANWQVVEERESGVAVVQNVWSPVYVDALILRDRDTDANGTLEERMYVQQDANFNVTAIINTAGVVQERYIYDPYGKTSYLDANFATRTASNFNWLYLHQGGRLDLISALYNFRNRDLSPTLGRWLQQDPLGYVDGVNLYQYVEGMPTNGVDPDGLWYWTNQRGEYCGPYVKLYTGWWCVKPNVWRAAIGAAGNVVNCWWNCEITAHQRIVEYVGGVAVSTGSWTLLERVRFSAKTAEELATGLGPAASRQEYVSILSRFAHTLKKGGWERTGQVLRLHQRFTKTNPKLAACRTGVIGIAITELAIGVSCSFKCS